MEDNRGLRTLSFSATPEDYRIAWLAALAITIHIAESVLPTPLPGIKPGLANVVTIAALLLYGWRAAVWVSLLRVVVGSILIGTFLTPTFVLSFSGAIAAITVIGLGHLLPGRGLGPVGYCLLASMAHIAAQFYVAYRLFIPHEALFGLLPVLMTVAVCFGVLSGIIVQAMMGHFRHESSDQHPA